MADSHRRLRMPHSVALAAALLALSGCARISQTLEATERMTPDAPVQARTLEVDDTLDAVRDEVVAVMEERDYPGVEVDERAAENTYRYTVDASTNEEVTETVTERHATVTASTADDRLVQLQVRERHRWGTSALDLLHQVGGEQRRTLERDGVEIAVPDDRVDELHLPETRAVFEEIERRLGDS